jgi:hypothetical protein
MLLALAGLPPLPAAAGDPPQVPLFLPCSASSSQLRSGSSCRHLLRCQLLLQASCLRRRRSLGLGQCRRQLLLPCFRSRQLLLQGTCRGLVLLQRGFQLILGSLGPLLPGIPLACCLALGFLQACRPQAQRFHLCFRRRQLLPQAPRLLGMLRPQRLERPLQLQLLGLMLCTPLEVANALCSLVQRPLERRVLRAVSSAAPDAAPAVASAPASLPAPSAAEATD